MLFRSGEGKKMSKSIGNVLAPEKIIKQYGADILRLWVSSSDFKSDVRISQDILKQLSEVYRKIRNTIRYMLGNCYDFDPTRDAVAYDQLDELDCYALHRLQVLVAKVTKAFEDFDFHVVFHSIHNFCVVEMSNFYMDVLKDRLYTSHATSPARRSAQTAMYEILETLVKLTAPVLTFTSDETWSYLKNDDNDTVQLAQWPQVNESYLDESLAGRCLKMLEYREVVTRRLEEARRLKEIGASLGASLDLYPDSDAFTALEPFKERLAELFIVSDCTLHQPSTSVPDGIPSEKGLAVSVKVAIGEKCERCWMVHPGVGEDTNTPTLCPRCSETVAGI